MQARPCPEYPTGSKALTNEAVAVRAGAQWPCLPWSLRKRVLCLTYGTVAITSRTWERQDWKGDLSSPPEESTDKLRWRPALSLLTPSLSTFKSSWAKPAAFLAVRLRYLAPNASLIGASNCIKVTGAFLSTFNANLPCHLSINNYTAMSEGPNINPPGLLIIFQWKYLI